MVYSEHKEVRIMVKNTVAPQEAYEKVEAPASEAYEKVEAEASEAYKKVEAPAKKMI